MDGDRMWLEYRDGAGAGDCDGVLWDCGRGFGWGRGVVALETGMGLHGMELRPDGDGDRDGDGDGDRIWRDVL